MWVFEVFQSEIRIWQPLAAGDEDACRETYDWYVENRSDLAAAGQLNLRNTDTDPKPPAALEGL